MKKWGVMGGFWLLAFTFWVFFFGTIGEVLYPGDESNGGCIVGEMYSLTCTIEIGEQQQ